MGYDIHGVHVDQGSVSGVGGHERGNRGVLGIVDRNDVKLSSGELGDVKVAGGSGSRRGIKHRIRYRLIVNDSKLSID